MGNIGANGVAPATTIDQPPRSTLMSDDGKFLGVAALVLAIPLMWPVSHSAAIFVGVGLLVLLCVAANGLRPR